jgi:NarL family two-component system response regulator LiaR
VTSRLLLAHPEPFFRECLAGAIAAHPDLEVAAVTGDEKEAASLARERAADLVVAESVLDAGSGLSLARRVRGAAPVVILTPGPEAQVLMAAVQAGAVGCVSHESGLARLLSLLAGSRPGRFVLDPDRLHETLKRVAGAGAGGGERPSRLDVLSAREREVLSGLAAGLDNDAIADRLYLSPNTVRTHVGNILKKLGVHSRAEAARLALREESRADTHVLHVEGPDLSAR